MPHQSIRHHYPNPAIEIPDLNEKFASSEDGVGSDLIQIEKAFGQVFDGLQGIEKYFSFSHFPNISLYPIAVYRELRSNRTQSE